MRFIATAVSLVPFLAASVSALPSAAAADTLVELKLPAPNNYLASDIFQGQQIYVKDNRGHNYDWNEETWTDHAKCRCISTPGCSTVNSYHLEPSEIINGTEKSFWFFDLYAGPKSTASDWVHSIFPITHQRIFTIPVSH